MSEINITPVNADAAVNAVRYAVKSLGTWASYVADNNVTRETVADHARALAALAFPKDDPIQKSEGKRTRFGNAVQAAGNGMRRALDDIEGTDDSKSTPDYLALAVQAARTAHSKGEIGTDDILTAITAALMVSK